MKKLLTLLLTLVMAICLVNINTNITEAKESGGTLYFGKGTGDKWSLWKDESLNQEYTGNSGKWSVDQNTHELTLKNEFKYEVETGGGIDFTKAGADTTLIIDGNVEIKTKKDISQAILFPKDNSLTIKGKTGIQKDVLKMNAPKGSSKVILQQGSDDPASTVGSGVLKIINCTVNADSDSDLPIISVFGLAVSKAKLKLNNKDTGAAILCCMKDTTAIENFADTDSSLELNSKEIALRIIADASVQSTICDAFNAKYTFQIKDFNGKICTGYLVNTNDSIFELYYEKVGPGSMKKSTPFAKLITVTAKNTAKATYSGGVWNLMVDGAELPDRRTAANPDGKWDISGNDKKVTLTLYDGFELGSTSVETISFTPTNEKNLDVTIKVEGKADIVSNYNGNEKHAVIKANKSTDGTKTVKKLEIVGNGNSELTILAGSSTYNPASIKESATTVIDAPDAKVKMKDVKVNLAAPDHVNKKRVTGIEAEGLTLDNSHTTIKAGKTPTEVTPPSPPSITAYLGVGMGSKEQLKLEFLNQSKLEFLGSAAAWYSETGSKFEITGDKTTIKGAYDIDGDYPVEEVKYGEVNLSDLDPSLTPFDTFYATSSDLGGAKVPLQYIVIENVYDPSPSPSKKDESCEKVIGPTWHWNNTKGICEDVGVVGTATR